MMLKTTLSEIFTEGLSGVFVRRAGWTTVLFSDIALWIGFSAAYFGVSSFFPRVLFKRRFDEHCLYDGGP